MPDFTLVRPSTRVEDTPQTNDEMSDSDYDIISIDESEHEVDGDFTADNQPGALNGISSTPDVTIFPRPITAAELVSPIASLEQQVAGIKKKIFGTEEYVKPLHDDIRAIANGTLEAVSGLGFSVTKIDGALCRTIDLIQETKAQLGETEEKVACLEIQMGGLDLVTIVQDIGHLFTATENIGKAVTTLKTDIAGFDLGKVVEDLDFRFHSVCEKVRRLEKQMDEFSGIREKLHDIEKKMEIFADQSAKIAAQDEKILLLEQKLDRFSSYFDKVDALENQVDSFSGLRSRVTSLENKTDIHGKDLSTIVHDSQELRTFVSKNVAALRNDTTSLSMKLEDISESQAEAASFVKLQVMSTVDQAVSRYDEKQASLHNELDLFMAKTEERLIGAEERLLGLEKFENSAVEKMSKLRKQTDDIAHLQDKVTKFDSSMHSSLRMMKGDIREESARVSVEFTLIRNDTKTLFKKVDSLDGTIGLQKKKLADLDKNGPAVIPSAVAQAWKNLDLIKMRFYPDFQVFKGTFTFYAKAAGVPEHTWKQELHSRMSTRMKNATAWRLEKIESFNDFCRYAAEAEQRLNTMV